jgi:predicted ATPase
MLQKIEIKNFKSIKKKNFALRNLNLLFGLNGMGKSSFIQVLLALRQSNLGDRRMMLSNNGNLIKLGSTKDVLYQYSRKENMSFHLEFKDKDPITLEFDYKLEADYFEIKNLNYEAIQLHLQPLTKTESLFNDNFQYLSANRAEPTSVMPKNYSNIIYTKNLGSKGEFTTHYLEVYSNEDIEFDNVLHPKSSIQDAITNKTIVNKTLINQVNLWMSEISPDIQIRTTSINSDLVLLEYTFKQPNFGFTNRFKPENVGFGITYVLPVVVALLKAKAGDLIIIENPESHIHPRGQAELGKLISLVAQNDVQIVVETHSDHIFNGIRVAVKEEMLDKNEVIGFYFKKNVTASEQYSKITDIKMDKNGTLSEYPENLLDEWSNQLSKLI